MYKRIAALLAVLLLLLITLPVLAEGTETGAGNGYRFVFDDAAGLLDKAEYADVQAEMEKITEFTNVGFYTYDGSDTTAVTDKARLWCDAHFAVEEECVVFVIDMRNRELAVWSSSQVQKTLTIGKANMICSNIYKMATKGQYANCAREAYREIYTTLSGEKVSSSMKTIGNILMAIIGAILLTYLVISARMEQEVKVSVPEVITATAGVGAAIVAKKLTRVVHHESSRGGGGFGGGGGGGFSGGGHSGGGGSHGF